MPNFNALHSSTLHNGRIEIRLIDDDNDHHYLRFAPGIVPVVVLALLNQARKVIPQDQRQREEQHLQLQSVTELAVEGGDVGLRLHTDGGLEIPIRLSPPMIGVLKKALSDIEAIAAPRDPNKATH